MRQSAVIKLISAVAKITGPLPGVQLLCDRVCLVLVCRGRGGVSSLHSGIEFGRRRTSEGSSGGRKKGVV
jgi:hypothetical protein